ncbi:MAG TPA: hypothetical protein VOA41_14455 [Candidatus Dormibacteraeota bacterium]|nr:hypothetical protein [Candidatus Dormibacteraeota bacterium]
MLDSNFCARYSGILLLVLGSWMVLLGAPRSTSVLAQRQAADAAEISRDLLYVAPQHILFAPAVAGGTRVPTFISRTGQGYQLTGAELRPMAEPNATFRNEELAPKGKRTISAGGTEYTVTPHSDDDRATLTLSKPGDADELVTTVLWTREQLASAWLALLQSRRKTLTTSALRADLEVSDPVIYDVQYDGTADRDGVWVAIGHSTGESELGIGTVVRFDLAGKRAKIYQPREVSTCAVTQLAISADKSVWVASRRQYEGVIRPCAGLLRLDPPSGQTQAATPGGRLDGAMVTAVGFADRLWVGTDAGICSSATGGSWDCKPIVPTVSVRSETPVSNLPGEKPSGKLKPGDYEVRWANNAFLEVLTKDSFDAWIAADDFQEASQRNFDVEPYKLLNTSGGGPAPIRLLATPGADASATGALVYRATLERLASPAAGPAGWIKVRAHTGWIERKNLEVLPKLVPAEGPAVGGGQQPAPHPLL